MDLLPDVVLVILFYAAVNCCRISEILNIRASAFIGEDRYVVRALKRSRSYSVHLPLLHPYAVRCANMPADARVFALGYRWFWQWCERIGLGFTPAGNQNVARTHAHRYCTAAAVSTCESTTAASDVMHHNSRRSVLFYLK